MVVLSFGSWFLTALPLRYSREQLLDFYRHHDPAMLPSIDAIMDYSTEKLTIMMKQLSASLPQPVSTTCTPAGAGVHLLGLGR